MKKNIVRMIVVSIVVGAIGSWYWYYDSGGGFGAALTVVGSDDQASDTAIVDAPVPGANDADDSAPSAVEITSSSPSPTTPESITVSQEQNSSAVVAMQSTSTSSAPSAPPPSPTCSFPSSPSFGGIASRRVILNEIAWMGSVPTAGETSAKASEQEWIEVKNISSGTVDLSGWQILDEAGKLKVAFGNATSDADVTLPAGGFYVAARGDVGYSGAMSNAGDQLALLDPNCNTDDFLDASSGWPGGNNTTKQTLERDADGVGWHTSAAPGGTPDAENSLSTPAPSPSAPIIASATVASVISVSLPGSGMGTVSSSPAGVLCGLSCEGNYAAGTKVSFLATPADGSVFGGWLGECNGSTTTLCSFIVSSSIALAANFESIPPPLTPTIADPSVAPTSPAAPVTPGAAPSHLLITQIQIAGAASSNDFIKIFNPTGASVDLTGWKLHKKSSTGTDYSLKAFMAGATIAPNSYFVWANSEGGFADSIGADTSSTETLSADNSTALFDANGDIIDQVAWGTGTSQYVEGAAYPTDPTAGQVLTRQSANGVMIDTDNNASDFTLTSVANPATPS